MSQNIKINGKILDEQSNAVIAATVSLISKDSVLISGTITDNLGNFELTTATKTERCRLRITHLEFETNYLSLIPDKDTTMVVHLNEKSILLNEIQIVAKKPVYEFQNEKLIVNVEEIPNVQTYNATKLLETLPGVNSNDGLTLNGQVATVYLNGKKQTMKLSDILQNLPVTAIGKIELIYSANGVYDASDGSVINIVYKQQRVEGYFLSVGGYATAYKKGHWDGGTNATIMFKKNNVMLNSMLSYRNNNVVSQGNDTLQYRNNALLYQDRAGVQNLNVYMGMANISWDFKEGHNLNVNFNFYDDFSNNTSLQKYMLQTDDINLNTWNVKSKGNDDMWAGQIEYTSPDTLNNKFKASYGIIYGGLRNHGGTYENDLEILHTDDEMVAHRHTVKFDYEHKFSGKLNLLFGLKTDLGQLNDNIIYSKTSDTDHYPANSFLGKENIYAGYAQLKYTFDKSWSASASLRSEYTYYFLDFKTLNENITDSYTNFFPYFTTSYNSKNRNYQSSLSFGSSIERPDYNDMLPGIRYLNQYRYLQGNPELKPTICNTLQWRNMLYQFINIYLGYQTGNNIEGIVSKNSSIDPLVIEATYRNIADYTMIYTGSDIYYQLFSDKLSGQIAGYVHNLSYQNPRNGFELPEKKSNYWRWTFNASCNYQITKQLGIYCRYFLYPGYNSFVYTTHTRWLANGGIFYNAPNDSWSLLLDINDLFHSNKTFRERPFGGNISREHSYLNSQYVQLSFVMKFKGGEKVEDKAKSGSLEMDRFSTK
ncbi:hypothetical protein FACS189413_10110 [Bacteroidia bacterium]|nr:hypothetical protein FACS189413_10110 [Bacteroidia bacterium]